MKSFMAYYGVGDHGGGATKENIKSIEELKTEKGAPALFFSTPEKYFKEIREEGILNLPVVKDDLQHHAVGCYTAESEIKKGNRQSEAALVTAEKIAAIGSMAGAAIILRKILHLPGKEFCFCSFTTVWPELHLYEHSQTAREGYGYALDIAHQATIYGCSETRMAGGC